MSDVRNPPPHPGAPGESPKTRRALALLELADLAGTSNLEIRAGELRLRVPFDLALAHVSTLLLEAAATAARAHARAVLRAAATLPAGALGSWLADRTGEERVERLEIGPDGLVRLVLPGDARHHMGAEPAEEGAAAGIMGGEAPGHLANDNEQERAERRRAETQSHSLDHLEPLVPRHPPRGPP